MTKALAIIGAIVCAWISGVGSAAGTTYSHQYGALLFLFLAALCGLYAWHL